MTWFACATGTSLLLSLTILQHVLLARRWPVFVDRCWLVTWTLVLLLPLWTLLPRSREWSLPIVTDLPLFAPTTSSVSLDPIASELMASAWSLFDMMSILWAIVALVLLGRLALGWLGASRAISNASPLAKSDLALLLNSTVAKAGLRGPLRIKIQDSLRVPAVYGILRPVILLPKDYERWPEDKLLQVVEHEIAHIQRVDPARRLIALIMAALHWPNPLVWISLRCSDELRECVCDSRVLASGVDPLEYAETLYWVRSNANRASLALPILASGRPSLLRRRIAAVLGAVQMGCLPRGVRAASSGALLVTALLAFAITFISPWPEILPLTSAYRVFLGEKAAQGWRRVWRQGELWVSLEVRGTPEFRSDSLEIESLTEGGSLHLHVVSDAGARWIHAMSPGGTPIISEGGDYPAGQPWFGREKMLVSSLAQTIHEESWRMAKIMSQDPHDLPTPRVFQITRDRDPTATRAQLASLAIDVEAPERVAMQLVLLAPACLDDPDLRGLFLETLWATGDVARERFFTCLGLTHATTITELGADLFELASGIKSDRLRQRAFASLIPSLATNPELRRRFLDRMGSIPPR